MTVAITQSQVQSSAKELARMRGALTQWLRYRMKVDQTAAASQPVKSRVRSIDGRAIARQQQGARVADEQALAQKLHALLTEVMPEATLPAASADNAVALARIALTGEVSASSPVATGASAWLSWPMVVAASLLVVVVTAVRSTADLARDREEYACIQAGVCTDVGFWVKAAAIVGLGFAAYHYLYGRRT